MTIHAGIQMPLSVLVLAAEVRVGLWRRNGHVMVDQVRWRV